MTTEHTLKEMEPILQLSRQIVELVKHTGVDHQTALDALKITMGALLVEAAENDMDYFEATRKRGLWREILEPQ